MKYAYYILFSLLIFSSCNTDKDLHGVWIGAYQIHHNSKDSSLTSIIGFTPQDSSIITMKVLLDISKDKIVKKTLDYHMFNERDDLEIFPYTLEKNCLLFGSDTFKIKILTKDSLILTPKQDCVREFVFKKIIESDKKLRTNLINKSYLWLGDNYTDTIDFINDSLFLHIGQKSSDFARAKRWSIYNYKSFDFLVFNQFLTPPLLIDYDSCHEIGLKRYYTNTLKFKLSELSDVKDTTDLTGNWQESFLGYHGSQGPPPPPLPAYAENTDFKEYLRIKPDSIEFEHYGKVYSKKWKLNSTHDFIYFTVSIGAKNEFWRIVKLDENNLIIDRYRKQYGSFDKKRIKFVKEKNSR